MARVAYDVLVIGGGLAGTTAALAAKKAGCSVGVASRGWGATAQFGGALQLAFSPLGAQATLLRHVEDLATHQPHHPFARLGAHQALEAMAKARTLLSEAGVALGPSALVPLDNEVGPVAFLPSEAGALIPVAPKTPGPINSGQALGPQDRQGGVGPSQKPWGVLDLAAYNCPLGPRCMAGWAFDAASLGVLAPEFVALAPTQKDAGLIDVQGQLALAKALDDVSMVRALLAPLKAQVAGLAGLLVSPVMGLLGHEQAMASARDILGLPVVEAFGYGMGAPGARLMMALDKARTRHDVAAHGAVITCVKKQATITAVHTSDGSEICARDIIWAGGRFLGGGLEATRGAHPTEPLMQLQILGAVGQKLLGDAHERLGRYPGEAHALAAAGVAVDEHLRPRDEAGRTLTNVRAIGVGLGGFLAHLEASSDGVALATSFSAAKAAMSSGVC